MSGQSITINAKTIGERLKQQRIESNMTQEVAASLCGISKKTWIKIEKGGDVYVSTLLRALNAFGIQLHLDIPQKNDIDVVGGDDDWF